MEQYRTDGGNGGATVERATHDPTNGESTATAVVMAVGRAKGVEPTGLPRLESTINTDALDRLVRSMAENDADSEAKVSFRYAGVDVSVDGSGDLVVWVAE
ncbi:HalOD1 output domain-containing protein [Halorarum halobium]|uniref:HalOD1 output domain-containing protein n=1 Tax=Halorarum halobium TaxID=3075121 RepID=UPI0028A8E93A|nr:HalOD1 output domain-containing protein [Halobaculum sp. XH14]